MTELEQTKQALADRNKELEQVKRVANELSAQNKALCSAIEDVLYGGEQVGSLAELLTDTPAQCLAEIKAQAAKDAISSALRLYGEPTMSVIEIDNLSDKYANQLLQQAKGG